MTGPDPNRFQYCGLPPLLTGPITETRPAAVRPTVMAGVHLRVGGHFRVAARVCLMSLHRLMMDTETQHHACFHI